MKLRGTIVEVKSFYVIVTTDEYKQYKLLKKSGMKVQSTIEFYKEDIIKFNITTIGIPVTIIAVFILAILFILFGSGDDDLVIYIDSRDSYELKIDDNMSIFKAGKYVNDGYEKTSIYDGKLLNSAVIDFIQRESEHNQRYFSISFIISKKDKSKYLAMINSEILKVENWLKDSSQKEIKLIVNQADENDREEALKEHVPIGKYIVYKYEKIDESVLIAGLNLLSLTDLFENDTEGILDLISSGLDSNKTALPKITPIPGESITPSPTKTPVITTGKTVNTTTIKPTVKITANPSALSPTQTVLEPIVYQAENAVISNGANEAEHSGYTGTGYVNYTNDTAAYVEFTVEMSEVRTAQVTIRYSNGSGSSRQAEVLLNGEIVNSSLAFPATSGWETWQTVSINLELANGVNLIRLKSNNGPNLDKITLTF